MEIQQNNDRFDSNLGRLSVPSTMSLKDPDEIIKKLLSKRPILGELSDCCSLAEYTSDVVKWNPSPELFSGREALSRAVVTEARRLYGDRCAEQTQKFLSECWAIETASHVHLPRKRDTANGADYGSLNPLIFQGELTWAATHAQRQAPLCVGLHCGRVPASNANSGMYLDLPSAAPFKLLPKKFKNAPQTFIPRLAEELLKKVQDQIQTAYGHRLIPKPEFELGCRILRMLSIQEGDFSDQIVTTHSELMGEMTQTGVQYVTLDSEKVAIEFFKMRLSDPKSLIHRIFSEPALFNEFIQAFSGIPTGWMTETESPFYRVQQKDNGVPFLSPYDGELTPEVLIQALQNNQIIPRGVMKFFAFICDAGLAPVGGMNQSEYCTDIRNKAVTFVHRFLGNTELATAIGSVPTTTALISPCWGLKRGSDTTQLIDASTVLLGEPLSEEEIQKILSLSGADALLASSPSLIEFLCRGENIIIDESVLQSLHNKVVLR